MFLVAGMCTCNTLLDGNLLSCFTGSVLYALMTQRAMIRQILFVLVAGLLHTGHMQAVALFIDKRDALVEVDENGRDVDYLLPVKSMDILIVLEHSQHRKFFRARQFEQESYFCNEGHIFYVNVREISTNDSSDFWILSLLFCVTDGMRHVTPMTCIDTKVLITVIPVKKALGLAVCIGVLGQVATLLVYFGIMP